MHILLVEDSEEVSCITVEYLRELGHQVVAVREAEKAIEHLNRQSFDTVMTDIRLPGMSGIDLARALAQEPPQASGGNRLRIRRAQSGIFNGRKAADRADAAEAVRPTGSRAHARRGCRDRATILRPSATPTDIPGNTLALCSGYR